MNQFAKQKLTDIQCEEIYNDWSNNDWKLIVDSPIGKQVWDWVRKSLKVPTKEADFQINSFKEFISPVDGKRIASTKQLRDHERQHGMKQCGNDFNNKQG